MQLTLYLASLQQQPSLFVPKSGDCREVARTLLLLGALAQKLQYMQTVRKLEIKPNHR